MIYASSQISEEGTVELFFGDNSLHLDGRCFSGNCHPESNSVEDGRMLKMIFYVDVGDDDDEDRNTILR